MNTPARYQNAKWEDVPKPIQDAFAVMLKSGKGIYLHGGVGTGKTHICWALKHHYSDPRSYRYLILWNVVDLVHEIRKDIDRHYLDKRRPEEDLTAPDERRILILDDIGAERTTDFAAETLYRIINHRYIHNLPTIFTSNCSLQELADQIGERSASRIAEMCEIYELTGKDRRITK
jgi:DNA replication protein DnaC